jgi:hypothetical protein
MVFERGVRIHTFETVSRENILEERGLAVSSVQSVWIRDFRGVGTENVKRVESQGSWLKCGSERVIIAKAPINKTNQPMCSVLSLPGVS